MKTLVVAAALALSLVFGSVAAAGDHCPAAQVVQVQQVVATPVVAVQSVAVQQVVAAPVFVVPSAPTVAVFQSVVATPVFAAVAVQHHAAQVVQQHHPAAVARSVTIQRTIRR